MRKVSCIMVNKDSKTFIVNTRDFGEIKVNETDIITFPNGLFAFEDMKEFILITPKGEDEFPMWLQSVESADLCFIVFDPQKIFDSFKPKLDKNTLSLLQIDDLSKARFLSIAVIYDDYIKTTINLKSPIVINAEKLIGAQVILDESYPFKHPLFSEVEGK